MDQFSSEQRQRQLFPKQAPTKEAVNYQHIRRLIFGSILLLAFLIGGCSIGCPYYHVWEQEMRGKAELAKAEQNRKIQIAEAEGKMEAAKALAEAEIERARGVAKANEIIGTSLKNNEQYLRYLWIEGLQSKGNQVIYVPTEAGLPILEAGQRQLTHK